MPRHVLDESRIHPAVRERVAARHRDVVDEVEAAVRAHAVVVVGMRANPYPRKACQLLQRAGIAHHYLEYGGYLSEWRRRNALKMWSGWPTFPMVFVQGLLVGGYDDLKALHDSGELARMLKG
jgi:glutaredoxin-related protein